MGAENTGSDAGASLAATAEAMLGADGEASVAAARGVGLHVHPPARPMSKNGIGPTSRLMLPRQ
jgi:hypothetical protein